MQGALSRTLRFLSELCPSPVRTVQVTIGDLDRSCPSFSQKATNIPTTRMKVIKVATRAEKANYRYCDFYCFMSLADFTAYISADDDADDRISISYASRGAGQGA